MPGAWVLMPGAWVLMPGCSCLTRFGEQRERVVSHPLTHAVVGDRVLIAVLAIERAQAEHEVPLLRREREGLVGERVSNPDAATELNQIEEARPPNIVSLYATARPSHCLFVFFCIH